MMDMRRPFIWNFIQWVFVRILFVLSICGIGGSVQAAETDIALLESRVISSFSLNDCLSYAYQVNPSIKAGRAAWKAAIETYRIETGYPDPQISTTYWSPDPSRDWSNKKFDASITQTIPFPGKLAAAGRVAETESHIARLELDRTVRDIAIQVRESYHELVYIREAARIAEGNRQALDRLRKIAETSYAGNRTALYDVMKAQSQSGQVQYDVLLLQELEKTEIARLNALMNRSPDAVIGQTLDEAMHPVIYELKEIYVLAETNRTENRQASAKESKSRAQADVARYQNLPEFMVGFQYEYDAPDAPDGAGNNKYGIQFGMTLPVWWSKNAGRREAARAEVEKTAALAGVQINETHAQIREIFFRLRNAERLVTLYRDQLLPQAQKAMHTAEIWNREGQGSFTDYVETEAVWYNSEAKPPAMLGRIEKAMLQYLK
jgi:outer membrane protein TolC